VSTSHDAVYHFFDELFAHLPPVDGKLARLRTWSRRAKFFYGFVLAAPLISTNAVLGMRVGRN
jgi:hypothetical protein